MDNSRIFESHCIRITDRHCSELTGIDDVLSFDEYSICTHSALGDLIIEGEELKIDSFSSENGLLCISGRIVALSYLDDNPKKHSRKKRNSK